MGDISVDKSGSTLYMKNNVLYGRGNNQHGSLGIGYSTEIKYDTPQRVYQNGALRGKRIKSLKCSSFTAFVLTDDSRLFAWGRNDNYETGIGVNTPSIYEATEVLGLEATESIVDFFVGFHQSFILSSSGNVYTFGQGTFHEHCLPN